MWITLIMAVVSAGLSLYSQNQQNQAADAAGQQAVADATAKSEVDQVEEDAQVQIAKRAEAKALAEQQNQAAEQVKKTQQETQRIFTGFALLFGFMALYLFMKQRVTR